MHDAVVVARFQLRRFLRDPMSWSGLAAFCAVLALGSWFYWHSLPPRPGGSRLFGEAYVVALILAAHCGIARDRMSRFDTFLAANFIAARDLYLGSVLTTVVILMLAGLTGFLFNLIATLGDLEFAAHLSGMFFLSSMVLLPVAVLIELVLNTRYPVPILILFLGVTLTVYRRFADLEVLLRTIGMTGRWDDAGGVSMVLARCVIAVLLALALYPFYRMRLGVTKLSAQ